MELILSMSSKSEIVQSIVHLRTNSFLKKKYSNQSPDHNLIYSVKSALQKIL